MPDNPIALLKEMACSCELEAPGERYSELERMCLRCRALAAAEEIKREHRPEVTSDSADPRTATKCSVCGDPTQMACADCRIDLRTTVYVCTSRKCRDSHEASACPAKLRAQLAAERQARMQTLEAYEHLMCGHSEQRKRAELAERRLDAAVGALRAIYPFAHVSDREYDTPNYDGLRSAQKLVKEALALAGGKEEG